MATLNENIKRIEDAKLAIKTSIESKGVTVGDGLIDTYASKIDIISTNKPEEVGNETIVSNGKVKFTPTPGSVYSEMNVDVQVPIPALEERTTKEITRNGNYTIGPTINPETSKPYDGMKLCDVNVNVPIPEIKLQEKSVTSNGPVTPDSGFDGLSKVDVNVPQTGGPIRLADHPGMRLGRSVFTTFTNDEFDFSGVEDLGSMFENCPSLTTLPDGIDFSSARDCSFTFSQCNSLTTLPDGIDFSNMTSVQFTLQNCSSLKSLPKMNFGKVTNIEYFLGWGTIDTLTDLGGFTGLKIDWNDDNGLVLCPNLTKQSVLNVINELYDFRAAGDPTTTKTIKFHANSLALLSEDEKLIATNKGWNLVS